MTNAVDKRVSAALAAALAKLEHCANALADIKLDLSGAMKQAEAAMEQALLVLDTRERQGQATQPERYAALALDEALEQVRDALLYCDDLREEEVEQ